MASSDETGIEPPLRALRTAYVFPGIRLTLFALVGLTACGDAEPEPGARGAIV